MKVVSCPAVAGRHVPWWCPRTGGGLANFFEDGLRGSGTALARHAAMATRKSTSRSKTKKRATRRGSAASGAQSSRSGRRYGPKASEKVERAMHEMKEGELTSGRSGRKVRSRKQAIAIGLSEARRAGGKVPAPRSGGSRGGKQGGKGGGRGAGTSRGASSGSRSSRSGGSRSSRSGRSQSSSSSSSQSSR
jgi:hypothetical protein